MWKHDFKLCPTAKNLKIIKPYGKLSNNRFLAVTPTILEGKIIFQKKIVLWEINI